MVKNVYNASKLAFHGRKLNDFYRGKISAPIYVRIKPTNKCNHRCFYCSYVPGNDCPVSEEINFMDEIPREKLLEILSDFKEIGVKAITFSGGGEPLIYPHIVEVMRKAKELDIEISIITNGQELKGGKAEVLKDSAWVRISAGEIDAETFEVVRKRPKEWFYSLGENIKEFSKIKSPDCELGINYVVTDKNYMNVYEAAKYFKELGVNHIKFTPVYMHTDFFGYHEPFKESVLEQLKRARDDFDGEGFIIYDTYENDFELTSVNERRYDKCFIMQTVPVIGADSCVYFCHDKTYTKHGMLGSLKERSFRDLWFSEEAERIFETLNPKFACRHHCTYDSRNLLCKNLIENFEDLERFKPSEERFKNFI
ncbi:radical SAM protein [archaeon]|nr:radical SAM protein [archaeon]